MFSDIRKLSCNLWSYPASMAPPPAFTLPFDILYQIFVLCLPENAVPSSTEAPLLLAGICREWRDIALSIPSLWNTIDLKLSSRTILKRTRLLEVWKSRAANLPSRMSLVYGDRSLVRHPPLEMLEGILNRHASDITTIELALSDPSLIQRNPRRPVYASLAKLVLDCGFCEHGIAFATVFSECPNLRELHIISGWAGSFALPWTQLTALRLDKSTLPVCLITLALLPNLVDVQCTHLAGNKAAASISPLFHLESITFSESYRNGPALLSYLSLPALRHLDVDLDGSPQIAQLTSLIARSSCSLRRLSAELRAEPDDLSKLFLALDSLQNLELKKCTPSVVHATLALLTAQPHLLPHLATLQMDWTLADRKDVGLLTDFLESRWNIDANSAAPIRLETLGLNPDIHPPKIAVDWGTMLRLNRLREEGMDIPILASLQSWFSFS
ncbi:hypothetical protein C8R46DRAFT_278936 [Mycena filopes]|nr:hypothetical protein C8R46DRAFT_278936 [Mycena filopes]